MSRRYTILSDEKIISLCDELCNKLENFYDWSFQISPSLEHITRSFQKKIIKKLKFINENVHIFSRKEKKELSIYLQKFNTGFRKFEQGRKLKDDMKKKLLESSIHNSIEILDYKLEDFINIIKRSSTQQEKLPMPLHEVLNIITKCFEIENIPLDLWTDEQSQKKKIKLNLSKYVPRQNIESISVDKIVLTLVEIDNVLEEVHDYLQQSDCIFIKSVRTYLYSLVDWWNKKIHKKLEKMMMRSDLYQGQYDIIRTCYYVGSILLRRIGLAIFMVQDEEKFMKYTELMKPTLQELQLLLDNIFLRKEQKSQSVYQHLLQKMRKKALQKTITTIPTQQQVNKWQQQLAVFLKQLQHEMKEQEKSNLISITATTFSKQQYPSSQQKTITQEKTKKPTLKDFDFSVGWVDYRHNNDIRYTLQQNNKMEQRKNFNIENIKQSLLKQSIPERIMRIALQGQYTSILLVDVANQRDKLTSRRKQQLVPIEIPPEQRKKPLFVYIEQGDLDVSRIAKVDFQQEANLIRISVSCAKRREDGSITDCFIKQSSHDLTKNPMDDFVLLTLRQILRSYYYKYMSQLGRNVKSLEKIQEFQSILADNPYGVLLDDPLLQKTLSITLYNEMPYTWSVSDDKWRDWKKQN